MKTFATSSAWSVFIDMVLINSFNLFVISNICRFPRDVPISLLKTYIETLLSGSLAGNSFIYLDFSATIFGCVRMSGNGVLIRNRVEKFVNEVAA